MPCNCGEGKVVGSALPSTSDQTLVARFQALAFIRSAKMSLQYAKNIETCEYCKRHIQEGINKTEELEKFAELGVSWDLGKVPAWKIVYDTIKAMARANINLLQAGIRRLGKRRMK